MTLYSVCFTVMLLFGGWHAYNLLFDGVHAIVLRLMGARGG
jgi:hypothetical protein